PAPLTSPAPMTSRPPRPEPKPWPSRTQPAPSTAVPLVQFREPGEETSWCLDAARASSVPSTQQYLRAHPYLTTVPSPQGDRSRAFQLEQQFLALETATVAGQAAVAADHPVAGHDDRDRVGPVGQADHARGDQPLAERQRDVAVADRAPVRDLGQLGPHGHLERGPARRQRHGELLELAGEVRLELRRDLAERLLARRQAVAGAGRV